MIAGADWCCGAWLLAFEAADSGITIRRTVEFRDILQLNGVETLVIDIPIGLADRGARACDVLARKLVRPRHSSVFTAPIRRLLSAATYEEASQMRRELEGKGVSKQAYGIYSIIASVDRHMTPEVQTRVREGHPEVTFAHLNGGHGLGRYKGTPEGREERTRLLEPHFPELGNLLGTVRPRSAVVDLLDALAMLWTARRVTSGEAISIPDPPEYDSRGLRMEMVA